MNGAAAQLEPPVHRPGPLLRAFYVVLCVSATLPGCVRGSLEPGDRQLLLTASALEPYGIRLPGDVSAYETLSREKWFDGSVMLEYEFDATSRRTPIYMYSLVEIHPTQLDACLSHESTMVGTKIAGIELRKRNDLFDYGDRSDFGILMSDDRPYGNYFSMCRGRTSFSVMLSGVYFDDGEVWGELVAPALEALEARQAE